MSAKAKNKIKKNHTKTSRIRPRVCFVEEDWVDEMMTEHREPDE